MDHADQQGRYVSRPNTDALPDDCTCSWINYSDSTGWFLKSRDPYCPSHGYQEPIGEGPPDGNNPRTGIAWNE